MENESFVARIYGVLDNPKGTYEGNAPFLSGHLKEMIDFYDIPMEQIWGSEDHSLWEARFYPEMNSIEAAVRSSLILCKMAEKRATVSEVCDWLDLSRTSLRTSFNQADVEEVLPFREKLKRNILIEEFVEKLSDGENYEDALEVFGKVPLEGKIKKELLFRAQQSDYCVAMRIYYALGMMTECFEVIKGQVFESMAYHQSVGRKVQIVKDEAKVALPLRVNWGGGWTDTPPYCYEHGGMVLNAAIKLNDILPVKVVLRKLDKMQVEFESEDLGVSTIIHELEEIQDCMNPYDFFALHKAALLACGLISPDLRSEKCESKDKEADTSLEEILQQLGGGIYLSTSVESVPKGSGLGTSSILAGACAKAIAEFTGRSLTDNALFEQVLYMEQLMSTGGGWQDQVGGLVPGIKMITSKPGVQQMLNVEPISISDKTKGELKERFAIIYTGQRRLARNLLRDVVGNYIGGRVESVQALSKMKEVAVLMQKALERGDVDELAVLFNRHWELSLMLDSGATNLCIDQIFMTIEDLIDGRFIAGAGGGGFLQIIMKKGVTKEKVNERLTEVFQGTGVSVWNSELYFL